MHILWTSNYSSQSGYSIQSRLFVPRINASGHRVTVFELANGTRLPTERDGIRILSTALDPLGSDMLAEHARHQNAHCVITLVDAWGMNKDIMRNLNWYPYAPVDTHPIAPRVVDALGACRRPIAMSQYGFEQMRRAGFDPFYMPHAIDPAIWHPLDKAQARRAINIPDNVFMVSFVGVNDSVPSRKGLPELMMAWQMFTEQHNDALLYLHTTNTGNLAVNNVGGVQIRELENLFGINPATLKIVDEYKYRTAIPAIEMAIIAAAADVLVLPTRGEGFGIPVLEYAAVGTPAIVTDFATSPELNFGGWLVEYEPEWSWQNTIVAKPSVASIVERLEEAYAERGNPYRRQACIEGARAYHIDHVFPTYTLPILREIAYDILERVS